MKKLLLFAALIIIAGNSSGFAAMLMPERDSCNVVVINDTEEQNGIFITGTSGQKAAIDIPVASDVQITITGIKVTLSSMNPPTFVHFRFYNDTLSSPVDPEDPRQEIPGNIMFDVTNTVIDTFVVVGYEPDHQFYVRNITMALAEPIILKGSLVNGRYWMGVIADANAWATTAHYETGVGVVGESVAMGASTFDWFQMINLEGLYELTSECDLMVNTQNPGIQSELSIYPNPAGSYLSVNYLSGKTLIKVELYNISGQKVREFNTGFTYLNLSGLNDGLYMVRIIDNENKVINRKIIVAAD